MENIRQWLMMLQIRHKHRLRVHANTDPDVRIATSSGFVELELVDGRKAPRLRPHRVRFGRLDMAAWHDMRYHGGSDHGNV